MADENVEETEETPPVEPPAGADTEPQVDHAKEAEKWKVLARKHEAQAKANADAAARLKELEDAGKSETEKLQSALSESQEKARKAAIKALKLEVASQMEIPASLAKFLPDTDNEVDMTQAANELLEAAGTTVEPPKRPKSPLNSPLGGDSDPTDDREKMLASMLGRPIR